MLLKALCNSSLLELVANPGRHVRSGRDQLLRIMKLTALLLFAACLHVSAGAYSQVTLSETNAPLQKVFKKIKRQTGYHFLFNYELLEQAGPVTVELSNVSLQQAIDAVIRDKPLTYEILDKTVIIKQKPETEAASTPILPIDVHGVVKDEKGKPAAGVNVSVKGTRRGTITNENGEFRLTGVDKNATLVFTSINLETREAKLNGQTELSLTMLIKTSLLGDFSVLASTGYQTLPKERATGSFVQIDNELLNRRVSTDVLSRLEGVVPGLVFNRNTINGQAGQTDISIRGTSTLLANNQPLIIVDGFPYNGDLANLNPNDYESITVLKDAAAASIWGVRSGNGVIVLTTKKGKRNQPLTAEVNTNITVAGKPDLYYNPNFLPSNDFINFEQNLFSKGYYAADLNTGYKAVTPVVQLLADQQAGTISASAATAQIDALRNVDVRKDLSKYFYQRAINQQYSLNLRGGGEKTDYYLSLGGDYDLASQVGNQNNRISLNSRTNFYLFKNFILSAGYNYTQSFTQSNSPVTSILMTSQNQIYPYAQLADANGNALPIVHDYSQNYVNTAGNGKFLDWNYRPLDELHNADNTVKSQDSRINLGANYNFLKYFNIELKYQYEKANINGANYYSLANYYTRNLINRYSSVNSTGILTTPVPVGGILQQSIGYLTSKQGRGQLNYNEKWGDRHEINTIGGFEISEAINESNSNTTYGYDKNSELSNGSIDYTTGYPLNPNGSSTIPNSLGFSKTTGHFISYYSNFSYTYNQRYIFSISGRIDKSNLFGVNTNQKAVPLYSTGLSYLICKEKFYNVNWLPYLKLRATYGYTGNINNSATAFITIRQFPGNYNFYPNGNPFDLVVNSGNPDLRWEKVRMINLGIDFGSKKEYISGSIEYFFKKGIDMFGNSPLPPSTGFTTFLGNTANIKGQGLDITLNSENLQVGDFSWSTNLLLSHVLDKVTRYNSTISPSSFIILSTASAINPLPGNPVYSIYSYRWGGLTHDTGDPQGYINGQPGTDYLNIVSNTTVKNMVYNGPARPATFGSFRNNFTYKRLTLSINLTYKLGYYFRRYSYTSASLPWQANRDYFQRWQKPGDELKTNVPSLQYPPYSPSRDAFYRYSSALVDKGDHIRIQDIRLGYDFKTVTIKEVRLSHVTLYGYVNNIGILWRANHDKLDPDLLVGSLLSTYPLPKMYALGFKADF